MIAFCGVFGHNDKVVKGSGASSLKLAEYKVSRLVDIELSGATTTDLNFDGILNADLSGCSILNYQGEGEIKEIETSGMSSIKKM